VTDAHITNPRQRHAGDTNRLTAAVDFQPPITHNRRASGGCRSTAVLSP
jgi:hypothetical protein